MSTTRITVEGRKGEWDRVDGTFTDDDLIASRPGESICCGRMAMTGCDCDPPPSSGPHDMHLHLVPLTHGKRGTMSAHAKPYPKKAR